MNKKIIGIFILICGVIVLGLELILTAVALVKGQGLSEGATSFLTTLCTGIFLIWFGLYLRKAEK